VEEVGLRLFKSKKDYSEEPLYCKICGCKLELKEAPEGYDPFTGLPKIFLYKQCSLYNAHTVWKYDDSTDTWRTLL
jgi:hypothetical protein